MLRRSFKKLFFLSELLIQVVGQLCGDRKGNEVGASVFF